jgi:hypothetical protein
MTNSETNIRLGDEGDGVKALQQRLAMLGHKLEADGIFGPKTEAAVKLFQTEAGLEADGIVGPKTRAALHPAIFERQSPDLNGMNAISRLIKFNGQGRYMLGAGGDNPNSATPYTWKGAVYGSDCIGAVCWAFGTPRFTKAFPEYGGWINCDSALIDSRNTKAFFEPVAKEDVVPGVLVVTPSIRASELWPGNEAAHGFKSSDRVRIGHIGIVLGWEGLQDPFQLNSTPWDGDLRKLVTIECRAAWPAIRMGKNVSFLGNTTYTRKGETFTNEKWGCRFLRFVGV